MIKIESNRTMTRSRSSSSSSDDDDVHSSFSSSDSDLSLIESSTKMFQQRKLSTSNFQLGQGTILRDTNKNFWMIHQCLHVSHRSERFLYLCSQVKRSTTDEENLSSTLESSTTKFLLKLELVASTTTRRKKHFTIDDEIAFYSRFATHDKLKSYVKRHGLMYIAIPEYIAHGTHKHLNFNWKFLVLEQYRENLRSLIYSYDQSLPEHNALNLFLQMLYVIQYLHEKNHVHQLIKPKYLMFANKQPFFIYLTQFRTVRNVHETDEKTSKIQRFDQ